MIEEPKVSVKWDAEANSYVAVAVSPGSYLSGVGDTPEAAMQELRLLLKSAVQCSTFRDSKGGD